MREILFRGKRKDNGEWIEGNLIYRPDTNIAFISSNSLYGNDEIFDTYITTDVIPETVGQYIGLTDKNGKKIFEGDIVKTDKFSEPNKKYIVKYDLQFGAFIGQDRYNMYFVTFDGDSDQFEIIGNIHDNPELLKEGETE